MSKKQKYLSLLKQMPEEWIRDSMNNPSNNMKPIHIVLHAIALRHLNYR